MISLFRKFAYIAGLICYYSDWQLVLLNRFRTNNLRKIKLRNGLIIEGGENSLIADLVDEIFIRKVYNPEFLPIKKGDMVIDIGANIGAYGLFAAKNGADKVFEIEPFPNNIPLIQKNFRINKLRKPIIEQTAVSDRNGKAKLYLGDLDSHNLLFDHNFKSKKFAKNILVSVATLSEIFEKYKIKKVDFLKIDCEGSEGQIVMSTPISVWKQIDKVAIEYHDGVSLLNHIEIAAKLKKAGYTVKIKKSNNLFGYIYGF